MPRTIRTLPARTDPHPDNPRWQRGARRLPPNGKDTHTRPAPRSGQTHGTRAGDPARHDAYTDPSEKENPYTPPHTHPAQPRRQPSSPARPPRRTHTDLLQILTEEGDPDRDSLPGKGPYASLVPPTSPWNTLGTYMIGIHNPSGGAVSPTLISPQRHAWLHATHSRLNLGTDFLQDLQSLMLRYHPRAETLNPQGRKYKPAN